MPKRPDKSAPNSSSSSAGSLSPELHVVASRPRLFASAGNATAAFRGNNTAPSTAESHSGHSAESDNTCPVCLCPVAEDDAVFMRCCLRGPMCFDCTVRCYSMRTQRQNCYFCQQEITPARKAYMMEVAAQRSKAKQVALKKAVEDLDDVMPLDHSSTGSESAAQHTSAAARMDSRGAGPEPRGAGRGGADAASGATSSQAGRQTAAPATGRGSGPGASSGSAAASAGAAGPTSSRPTREHKPVDRMMWLGSHPTKENNRILTSGQKAPRPESGPAAAAGAGSSAPQEAGGASGSSGSGGAGFMDLLDQA